MAPRWTRAGCAAVLASGAGIATARVAGWSLDGSPAPQLLAFLGVELALGAAAGAALGSTAD